MLAFLPPDLGHALILALWPLAPRRRDVWNHCIIILRKAMFSKEVLGSSRTPSLPVLIPSFVKCSSSSRDDAPLCSRTFPPLFPPAVCQLSLVLPASASGKLSSCGCPRLPSHDRRGPQAARPPGHQQLQFLRGQQQPAIAGAAAGRQPWKRGCPRVRIQRSCG